MGCSFACFLFLAKKERALRVSFVVLEDMTRHRCFELMCAVTDLAREKREILLSSYWTVQRVQNIIMDYRIL